VRMTFRNVASGVWLVSCVLVAGQPARAAALTSEAASERVTAVASVLKYDAWPATSDLYVLPRIDEQLVSPLIVGLTGLRSCTAVVVASATWPECRWSWTDTTPPRQGRTHWVELTMTLTSDAAAAQAYLLRSLTDNALPTEELMARYGAAEQPAGLGSVALLVRRPGSADITVTFTRGNIFVRAQGHGRYAASTLPLAQAVDDALLNQRVATLAEVRAEAERFLNPQLSATPSIP